ncbi:uncharacterized protein LOC127002269 isoform X2 [Eriocheir sinensis]|uniref:uncharacterized protein LOC127002269 isoform X2 n=1 Tax=Eriocheir sinensis TaxID=95602 RepID=UPI0021C844D3|nr:uncharacterized protein LOC127002269 isoform X2 [Eriocheir sinensis]
MAWRMGCLLVGVLAWAAADGGPYSPSSSGPLRCDVEALRCDVICSFPDLGLHCSRCARRPMRFGKRGGNARTHVVALPSTSPSISAAGGDSQRSTAAAPSRVNRPTDQANTMDDLRFVGRPHFFLSKIFWRNSVGQNFPPSQERKVRPWRDRKFQRCLFGVQDPARCPPESAFRKLFHFSDDYEPRREKESNASLCDIHPEECSLGTDIGKRLNTVESSRTNSLSSNEFDRGLREETGRRKRFNGIETSNTLNSDDSSEGYNSIDGSRKPSLNSNDFDTDLGSETGRINPLDSLESLRQRLFNINDLETGLRSKTNRIRRYNNLNTSSQRFINSDDFDKDLNGPESSRTHSLESKDFDSDLGGKTTRSKLTRSFDKRERDNEKHKRRWKAADDPEKSLSPSEIDNTNIEETEDAHDFDPGRRRRSRRSVVEEVVEGLMEMLDLEVLPVNPKHYGCHNLPYPGRE